MGVYLVGCTLTAALGVLITRWETNVFVELGQQAPDCPLLLNTTRQGSFRRENQQNILKCVNYTMVHIVCMRQSYIHMPYVIKQRQQPMRKTKL